MDLSGAEIVIEALVSHGIDTVFGYPGGYVINIYDELYKNSHRISHILTAHEQGAAHAADAYARVTGKTSAVIATSGPGATNLITGIANAYLDSVPVVFITGNVPVPMLGGDSFQEIDVIGVTLPIVKHSYVVKDVRKLQRVLNQAFLIAGTDRKGPVLVDIPKCVQLDKCEYEPCMNISRTEVVRRPALLNDLDAALEAIKRSSRPYIYCGGGVTATNTGAGVIELSKKIGAPVGMSMMGIGSVPHSYELNLGMSGMHGRYASTAAMSESDLIIALGVRFSDRATGNTNEYAKNSAIIHADIDAAEIGKNVRADFSLCGDLKDIIPMLLNGTKVQVNKQWIDRIHALKKTNGTAPTRDFSTGEDSTQDGDFSTGEDSTQDGDFTPRNIICHVNSYYDDDTVVTTDVGQHQMWVAQYYRFEKPRKLITSGGLGAMGFGLGAAVGASIARGRKRVVLFTSEGSFGMNLTEMATAVTQKLPITIILLNNGVLGMVRQWQALFFNERYSQTTLDRKTDFPALAKAFGAAGYSAHNLTELDGILQNTPDNAPCLIDCKIDKDEKVLPMIPVGGTIRDILIT